MPSPTFQSAGEEDCFSAADVGFIVFRWIDKNPCSCADALLAGRGIAVSLWPAELTAPVQVDVSCFCKAALKLIPNRCGRTDECFCVCRHGLYRGLGVDPAAADSPRCRGLVVVQEKNERVSTSSPHLSMVLFSLSLPPFLSLFYLKFFSLVPLLLSSLSNLVCSSGLAGPEKPAPSVCGNSCQAFTPSFILLLFSVLHSDSLSSP